MYYAIRVIASIEVLSSKGKVYFIIADNLNGRTVFSVYYHPAASPKQKDIVISPKRHNGK